MVATKHQKEISQISRFFSIRPKKLLHRRHKKKDRKKKKCSATLFNRAPTKKRPTSKTFDLYLTADTVALHDASFHHSLKSNTKKCIYIWVKILSLFTYQLYFEVGHARNILRTVELAPTYNSF